MQALSKNPKAELHGEYALAYTAITAASTNDATTVNGSVIDTTEVKAESILFAIPVKATLSEGMLATIKMTIEHSQTSNSGFATVVAEDDAALVLTGTTGGSVLYGVAHADVNLQKCYRYVRVTALCDLSHTGTDTAVIGAGIAELVVQEVPVS